MDLKLTKTDRVDIFENAICWIVVFGMLVYGAGKIVQFEGATNIDKRVGELTGMELMWAFYGYSKTFILIMGALEITGGLLMLFKKTRLLGCLLVTTILVNIILQDIFYGVHLGALKAAILYQSLTLIIFWLHRQKLFDCFKILIDFPSISQTKQRLFFKLFLAFIAFVIFRIAEYYVTIQKGTQS